MTTSPGKEKKEGQRDKALITRDKDRTGTNEQEEYGQCKGQEGWPISNRHKDMGNEKNKKDMGNDCKGTWRMLSKPLASELPPRPRPRPNQSPSEQI